ncbi:MAG TPA: hypothetical protein VEQ58_09940 [Polyangiaceae bacterium]|nr:hypothetical protein [Polyangiaceae bacterium]
MDQKTHRFRTRYPARAILAVVATGLLLSFNVVVGFLFMALVPPLIPVYVSILFGGASLVEGALRYAERVSIRQPVTMLRAGKHEEKVAERGLAARAA